MEAMLSGWRRCDRIVIHGTEILLFGIGTTFTFLVTLEVSSRFLFNFSIFFINAFARFLLVWFFLLGAGLALRKGAHVGFELLVQYLPASVARKVEWLGHLLVLIFFFLMIWSGLTSLPQALTETDSSLGISGFWVMLAFPVGFALLVYHHVWVMVDKRLGIRQKRGIVS